MKNILLNLLLLTSCCVFAQEYENDLTGKFLPSEWSKESNGLVARLCSNKAIIKIGQETPIFLLEIKNVSDKNIFINDTFSDSMLLCIKPQKVEYTNYDMVWIFNHDRTNIPLKPNETLRAICKLPFKLVPSSGKYKFGIEITRGIYPDKEAGHVMRGENWWTGKLIPLEIEIEYK